MCSNVSSPDQLHCGSVSLRFEITRVGLGETLDRKFTGIDTKRMVIHFRGGKGSFRAGDTVAEAAGEPVLPVDVIDTPSKSEGERAKYHSRHIFRDALQVNHLQ